MAQPFEVSVPPAVAPIDALRTLSLSAGDVCLDCDRVYTPATDQGRVQLIPTLAIPQFPRGLRIDAGRFLRSATSTRHTEYFGAGDDSDLRRVAPTIVPPMPRLTRTVEQAVASNDDTTSIEALRSELAACASATATVGSVRRLTPAAFRAIERRHADDGQHGLTAGINDVRCEVVLDVMERMSVGTLWQRLAFDATHTVADVFDSLQCASAAMPHPTSPHRFFFIGGAFCIDDRHADAVDLSAAIRAWVPPGCGLGPFSTCPVLPASTPLGSLSLRVGEKGVVRHNGLCDHIVQCARVGIAVGTQRGPRVLKTGRVRCVYCDVCRQVPATSMTYFDRLAPTHPALYCAECITLLHGEGVNDEMVRFDLPLGAHF